MPENYSFGVNPVTCHAWNKDRTEVALSLNNNEVEIHKFSAGKWTLIDTLTDHSQRVTGIDWAAKSNQIVTCAADCNAYVWTKESNGKWTPVLVVLRINRAATCVKWSPLENKFAVGSGAKLVALCYYDKDNNWWISKQIKKPIRSSVTSLDWHPNNAVIACGSSDFKARIYSAHIKEVDDKPPTTNWGSKLVFGTMLQEFSSVAGGWVHDIRFSPSGDRVAWVGHDSTVSIVDAAQNMKLTTVKTEFLPFSRILWTSENNIVAAGFDCTPMSFTFNGQALTVVGSLDKTETRKSTSSVSAMGHFKALDNRGTSGETNDTLLPSVHQNAITFMARHSGSADKCTKFSTSGTDGQLVTWDVK